MWTKHPETVFGSRVSLVWIAESSKHVLYPPLVEDLISGIPTETFVFALGVMEIGVGMSLIFQKLFKMSIAIMVTHLVSTFFVLAVLQETMINDSNPFLLTLEGEFIIKNLF
ncbi:MAG: hypothetical protein ACR2LL_00135 [Nitrosopumilus sp.]